MQFSERDKIGSDVYAAAGTGDKLTIFVSGSRFNGQVRVNAVSDSNSVSASFYVSAAEARAVAAQMIAAADAIDAAALKVAA